MISVPLLTVTRGSLRETQLSPFLASSLQKICSSPHEWVAFNYFGL